MKQLTELVATYPTWSMDHINALIAIGALALSAFAIYVVFALARERRKP